MCVRYVLSFEKKYGILNMFRQLFNNDYIVQCIGKEALVDEGLYSLLND